MSALPFYPGMRVEHKDVSANSDYLVGTSRATGVVVSYPVKSERVNPVRPDVKEWVHVRLDQPLTHSDGRALRDWLLVPENLIPLDEQP